MKCVVCGRTVQAGETFTIMWGLAYHPLCMPPESQWSFNGKPVSAPEWAHLHERISELEAQCERYRAALEWYAAGGPYDKDKLGDVSEFGCGCCVGNVTEDGLDCDTDVQGKQARDALGEG